MGVRAQLYISCSLKTSAQSSELIYPEYFIWFLSISSIYLIELIDFFGRIEVGNKNVERNAMISIHRMTEWHKDNLGCGIDLIKLNFMKVYLSKKNFLALRTVGIGSTCKECKLVCMRFRGRLSHARESHWNLSNTENT